MKSQVLRLSGMVGSQVTCTAPVTTYQELPSVAHPSIGQRGKVVGFIEDGEDYSVFVRMDGEQDFHEVARRSFDNHFRVVVS